MLTDLITNLAVRAIRAVNRHKNECLSHRLHRLADRYAGRPTGQWERERRGTPVKCEFCGATWTEFAAGQYDRLSQTGHGRRGRCWRCGKSQAPRLVK